MQKRNLVYLTALTAGCASTAQKEDGSREITSPKPIQSPAKSLENIAITAVPQKIQTSYTDYIPAICLAGAACLLAAGILYYRSRKAKPVEKNLAKQDRLVRLNLLPAEYTYGRTRQFLRRIRKAFKWPLKDYPMPGYSEKGWTNFKQ